MRSQFPDFLIIGAQKSGTSFLKLNLQQHPEISIAENNQEETDKQTEIHFFDEHWDRGVGWYQSLFQQNGKIWGEKSPEYLNKHRAHERMFQTVPNAKLIVIIRDPVERAYSQWNMSRIYVGNGQASHEMGRYSFEEALEKYPGIRRRGHYAEHLEHLMKYYPKTQLCISIFEEMIENPEKTLSSICQFIGVSDWQFPLKKNPNAIPYETAMKEDTRVNLIRYYQEHNKMMFQMLGRTVSQWN